MIFDIPVLVEVEHRKRRKYYRVSPLFYDLPARTNKDLSAALASLAKYARDELAYLTKRDEHYAMSRLAFAPETKVDVYELRFDLPRTFLHGWYPVVTFPWKDRRLAICPMIDDFSFEIVTGDDPAIRAEESFREYFRDLQRREGDHAVDHLQQSFKEKRTFWITTLSVGADTRLRLSRITTPQTTHWQEELRREGAEELRKVGQCLDWQYPDRLSQTVGRDKIVDRLYRLLLRDDRPSVMLVGPDMVGKTAIVHETVRRRVEQIERPTNIHPHYRSVWQVAPSRVISGMSMVGEWEHRLASIVEHAVSSDVTLYFDQVLAMLEAGKSRDSNVAIADVLRPAMQRRRIRVIAEVTDEQLRLLRERNRGLADLFEVIHVDQPESTTNHRIMLETLRRLEWEHRCQFEVDVLATIIELAETYTPESAMPGKVVTWLTSLAVRHAGSTIKAADATTSFREKSGLRLAFFVPSERIVRKEIETKIAEGVVGQRRAVNAMTDVAILAQSMLGDSSRPIASLLFAGPTGVGKTECAKQMARYYFGSEDRMLRLDANELGTSAAVARLVGTPGGGEGLLTGAVRRQPFCVLLIDEIEKAHPDLFDLLLQITGEARLTDAMGRVASFSQAIIVMTSNLGTREAAATIGFGGEEPSSRDDVYLRAIRNFFRPELINRIDRIVPFDSLGDDELGRIAARMLDEMTSRDGLTRRKSMLEITDAARGWIVSRGHDPTYGARSIRRAIEEELAQPIARFLAAARFERPSIIRANLREGQLDVVGHELVDADRLPESHRPAIDDPLATIEAAKAALGRLESKIAPHRPSGGLSIADLTGPQCAYFLLVEAIAETRELVASIEEAIGQGSTLSFSTVLPIHPSRGPSRRDWDPITVGMMKQMMAVDDIVDFIVEVFANKRSTDGADSRFERLLDRMAALEYVAAQSPWASEAVVIAVRGFKRSTVNGDICATVGAALDAWPLDETRGSDQGIDNRRLLVDDPSAAVSGLVARGIGMAGIARACEGTWLAVDRETGALHPVEVTSLPIEDDADIDSLAARARVKLNEYIATTDATWRPVTRIVSPRSPSTGDSGPQSIGEFFDTRKGKKMTPHSSVAALLPLPDELQKRQE